MKTLKANLKLIGLAWKGSKAWVIGTAVNAVINSPRNLIIDVLLVGTIYNFIQKGRDFSGMLPFLAALAFFYLTNLTFESVLCGRIWAVGNRKICCSIDRMLCGNAARMPLSSYDDPGFYEEYIYALRNCPDMAKEAVTNLSYLIGFLLGGLISIGLIASIQPVMLRAVSGKEESGAGHDPGAFRGGYSAFRRECSEDGHRPGAVPGFPGIASGRGHQRHRRGDRTGNHGLHRREPAATPS